MAPLAETLSLGIDTSHWSAPRPDDKSFNGIPDCQRGWSFLHAIEDHLVLSKFDLFVLDAGFAKMYVPLLNAGQNFKMH